MKHKLEYYRRQVRRQEITSYFSQRRQELMNAPQSNLIDLERTYQRALTIEEGDDEEPTRQNEQDIYDQWESSFAQLANCLANEDYEAIAHHLEESYHELRKVVNKKGSLYHRRTPILKNFLQTGYLSDVVRVVMSAFRAKVPPGLFQRLSRAAIGITHLLIRYANEHFGEEVFLAGDLLLFLRICNDEPKHDARHIVKIIRITHHMIVASKQGSGKLFSILNDKSSHFNICFSFFAFSRLHPGPQEQLCLQFLCLLQEYFGVIEESQHRARGQKLPELQLPFILNSNQRDLCFEIACESVNHFLTTDFMEEIQAKQSLEEALDVLRMLVEQYRKDSNLLRRVNYRGLIEVLNYRNNTQDLIQLIFQIIDHVIYLQDDYIYELAAQGDLLTSMWKHYETRNNFVMNILSNIIVCRDRQIQRLVEPYIHQIFTKIGCQKHLSIYDYNFVYNWFCTRNFEVTDPKEEIMVGVIADKEPCSRQIEQLDQVLWVQLAENNFNMPLPLRAREYIDQREREQTL